MLFSEPKIPQLRSKIDVFYANTEFQCSSASRKFLNSFSFLILLRGLVVSVLFSEPKIPQLSPLPAGVGVGVCFSALQRAENSSILPWPAGFASVPLFQCSSASRKFLNSSYPAIDWSKCFLGFSALQRAENSSMRLKRLLTRCMKSCFSALQRAENSSIPEVPILARVQLPFQCSSASRKFLNEGDSALQRAELPLFQCSSASRKFLNLVLALV